MSPLKKDLKLEYFDLILKIMKTVVRRTPAGETVIRFPNLLLIRQMAD